MIMIVMDGSRRLERGDQRDLLVVWFVKLMNRRSSKSKELEQQEDFWYKELVVACCSNWWLLT